MAQVEGESLCPGQCYTLRLIVKRIMEFLPTALSPPRTDSKLWRSRRVVCGYDGNKKVPIRSDYTILEVVLSCCFLKSLTHLYRVQAFHGTLPWDSSLGDMGHL